MHTPQDRHPAAAASSSPTWAVKLAAEREEETIFYRYLSPCFPFVTTPLQNRKTHQGLTGAPGAPALSQGQPGLELPLARAVHTQAVISPNWVKCKREELREQQDFVSSSIPASAGWDAAAERLFRRQDHAATGALSPALRPCSVPSLLLPRVCINARGYGSEMRGQRRLNSRDSCHPPLPLHCVTSSFQFKLLVPQSLV